MKLKRKSRVEGMVPRYIDRILIEAKINKIIAGIGHTLTLLTLEATRLHMLEELVIKTALAL